MNKLNDIEEVRIDDFIMSLSKEVDDDILKLKEYAIKNDVPIIRDETKNILSLLLSLKKPTHILEIGTAIAYSTNIMHKICVDAEIVTIEDYKPRIDEAKKNIKSDKIKLIEQDAGIYLKENTDKEVFDFIFLDAAKAQYIVWLPDIKRLMKKGAILLADNIFKDGEILESKFLIKKRDRTIHKRMRDYLYTISNDKELDTYIYNIGDGIAVSIKREL